METKIMDTKGKIVFTKTKEVELNVEVSFDMKISCKPEFTNEAIENGIKDAMERLLKEELSIDYATVTVSTK